MSFPNALGPFDYELVIASQSTQTLGPVGKKGNVLMRVVIIPTTVTAGAVSLKDGSGDAFAIYDGGAVTPLLELKPITVELGIRSVLGAWQITTGGNVRVLAVGYFAS